MTTRKNWNKIHVVEVKYLSVAKGCTKADHIRNEDISKKLNIFSASEKINGNLVYSQLVVL